MQKCWGKHNIFFVSSAFVVHSKKKERGYRNIAAPRCCIGYLAHKGHIAFM